MNEVDQLDECHECRGPLDLSKKIAMIGPDYQAWCPKCEVYRTPILVLSGEAAKRAQEIIEKNC